MIYPYTLIFHAIMAGLCLLSMAYIIVRGQMKASQNVRSYFGFFSGFFVYNIFLIVPLLFFDRLNLFTFYFYVLALFALGYACFRTLDVGMRFLVGKNYFSYFKSFFVFGVVAAIALLILNPGIPTGSADGNWVFWYSYAPASYLYIFFMFVCGWSFAAPFFGGLKGLDSGFIRFRSILFTLGGWILPFASVYYFAASSLRDLYFAFFFSIVGLTLFAIGNIMGIFQQKKSE